MFKETGWKGDTRTNGKNIKHSDPRFQENLESWLITVECLFTPETNVYIPTVENDVTHSEV